MSLISTKGVYGLSAIYEIYLSGATKAVQIKDIAQNSDISQSYLEQILVTLKKAKFVKSIRGAYGGYMLAKDAKNIIIKDIFVALEKDISTTDLKTKSSALNMFYSDANHKLYEIFDISLFDLHKKYSKKTNNKINYTTFGL